MSEKITIPKGYKVVSFNDEEITIERKLNIVREALGAKTSYYTSSKWDLVYTLYKLAEYLNPVGWEKTSANTGWFIANKNGELSIFTPHMSVNYMLPYFASRNLAEIALQGIMEYYGNSVINLWK